MVPVTYQQQAFIATDQSAFQRAGSTGQYAITGQQSPLATVAAQTGAAQPQRTLNGQFMDPAATPGQAVGYEPRQEYVNGYQQQVSSHYYTNSVPSQLTKSPNQINTN